MQIKQVGRNKIILYCLLQLSQQPYSLLGVQGVQSVQGVQPLMSYGVIPANYQSQHQVICHLCSAAAQFYNLLAATLRFEGLYLEMRWMVGSGGREVQPIDFMFIKKSKKYWGDDGTLPKKQFYTFPGPLKSYIVKENKIGSVVSEIIWYTQTPCYFY